MAKTLLLVDGNSLLHRAYHALPPLTSPTGEMVNAVFGFSNMLLKAIGEVKPDYVACAFDTAAPTFRHIQFEEYKAQRPEPPPDLYPQLPLVKKVLDAFGIKYFEKEGYEADDIIATIASRVVDSSQLTVDSKTKRKKSVNHEPITVNQVVILSGDRDVLQLVDGNIKVQMPGWGLGDTTLYGVGEVKEKFGVTPSQMVDYKSLIGDSSDNVPGISGVGPKTASSLLQKYRTLESLFKNLDEVPETVRSKLKAGKNVALAAKSLVDLDRNVPIEFRVKSLELSPDWKKVREEMEKLGFKSIVAKLPGGQITESQKAKRSKIDKEKEQLELI